MRAIAALTLSVVTVRVVPYSVWRRRLVGASRVPPAPMPGVTIRPILRAIEDASRVVPGGRNCLARALAGRALLAQHHFPSEIVLGVSRGPDGSLAAHAWLRHDGQLVLGANGVEGYVPLPDLPDLP